MAFISLMVVWAVLGMAVFGAFCLILAIAMFALNRKRQRRWMKIVGIISTVLAVINLGVVGIFAWMVWMP